MKAKAGAEFSPDDFHPRLMHEKAKREEELKKQAPDALASLPKQMSNDEIEREWRILKDYAPKG